MMDDCLFAFLLGFFVCVVGVFLALMFDVGMDRFSGWFKRFF